MKFLIFFAVISMLCGCLSKMEKNTDETLKKINESIDEMRELKKGMQLLDVWKAVVVESEKEEIDILTIKNGIQSMFSNDGHTPPPDVKLAFEESMYRYFGMQYPIDTIEFDFDDVATGTRKNGIPNVVYVGITGKETYKDWVTLRPIKEKLLTALEIGVEDLLRKTPDQVLKEGLKDAHILRMVRLAYIAPAVFSAKHIYDLDKNDVYFRDTHPSPLASERNKMVSTIFSIREMGFSTNPFSQLAYRESNLRNLDWRAIHANKRKEIATLLVKAANAVRLKENRPDAYNALTALIEIRLKQVNAF